MGLLDDAIREHLELKRLRGVDPGAVAQEEQDALGSTHRTRSIEKDGLQSSEIGKSSKVDELSGPSRGSAHSTSDQETIEINMEVELAPKATSEDDRDEPKAVLSTPDIDSSQSHAGSGESFEWEMPRDQEDGSEESKGETDSENQEHVEDVLEETPDFLQETPEQERLWFEQRPPRDFDFNE